ALSVFSSAAPRNPHSTRSPAMSWWSSRGPSGPRWRQSVLRIRSPDRPPSRKQTDRSHGPGAGERIGRVDQDGRALFVRRERLLGAQLVIEHFGGGLGGVQSLAGAQAQTLTQYGWRGLAGDHQQ